MNTANSLGLNADNKIKKLSEEELEAIWIEFSKDKTNKKLRDTLIVQYLYLIKYVVNRIRTNLPQSIATDDITGYGVEGLMNAVERFDISKNARFETYALTRIRGTIIDKIRSLDWVSRGTRRRFKRNSNCNS